jgi:hypothetical protein
VNFYEKITVAMGFGRPYAQQIVNALEVWRTQAIRLIY